MTANCCLLGIFQGAETGNPVPVRKTWCGRVPDEFEWLFVDASHAALNGLRGGHPRLCLACKDAIVKALADRA